LGHQLHEQFADGSSRSRRAHHYTHRQRAQEQQTRHASVGAKGSSYQTSTLARAGVSLCEGWPILNFAFFAKFRVGMKDRHTWAGPRGESQLRIRLILSDSPYHPANDQRIFRPLKLRLRAVGSRHRCNENSFNLIPQLWIMDHER
jgi:hypothetical protein